MKKAILLLGHGSRASEANKAMYAVMGLLKRTRGFDIVEAGFMDLNPPTIGEGLAACVAQGAEKIIVLPYFLHMGQHVQRDLPNTIETLAKGYPRVQVVMGKHIGFHPKLVDIVEERIRQADETVEPDSSGGGGCGQS